VAREEPETRHSGEKFAADASLLSVTKEENTMRVLVVATPLILMTLAACQPAPPPGPAMLSDADKAGIEETTRAFGKAFEAKDWAGVAATYTEDAILLPPNAAAVKGRAAIQEFLGSFPPASNFQIKTVEVDGRGDLAYVYGTYSMTITPEGADPVEESGKYLEIRQKQADGSWLLHRDMFSSNMPAAQ